MSEFIGSGTPLSAAGLADVCAQLNVGLPELWAVVSVETRGWGFLHDRRPVILFERHVFCRESSGRFDAQAPDLSAASPGGYGRSGDHQYERLERALRLDRQAALKSASWGIGQVMGFHASRVGFADVESMVAAMVASEDEQLRAMFKYCVQAGIDKALREHDWAAFARGYNGRGYAKRAYHKKLAKYFAFYKTHGTPALEVRAAQAYLSFHGYRPGPVDGLWGARTRRALQRFQLGQGIAPSAALDERTLASLAEAFRLQVPRSQRVPAGPEQPAHTLDAGRTGTA